MSTSVTSRPAPSTLSRVRAALSPGEWASISGMTAFVVALHVIGWGLLLGVIAPRHDDLGTTGAFGAGLGVTAYTLGMRHAFDADHIAAIDNTTRKLMSEGRRPPSVGFWFSLGHSSIVFGLCLLLSLGVKALGRQVQDDSSTLQQTTGLTGTTVSGVFLYLIAALNLVLLVGILKVFRQMGRGTFDEAALEDQANNRGLMNRILGGAPEPSGSRGTGTRSACCSAWASTPRPRSACSSSRVALPRTSCPATRSSSCRCCSPPA